MLSRSDGQDLREIGDWAKGYVLMVSSKWNIDGEKNEDQSAQLMARLVRTRYLREEQWRH